MASRSSVSGEPMSNQKLKPYSGSSGADSHLAELVDQWITELSGGEFKIAAYLYRSLEQAGGKAVHLSARELAEAAGVSTWCGGNRTQGSGRQGNGGESAGRVV